MIQEVLKQGLGLVCSQLSEAQGKLCFRSLQVQDPSTQLLSWQVRMGPTELATRKLGGATQAGPFQR